MALALAVFAAPAMGCVKSGFFTEGPPGDVDGVKADHRTVDDLSATVDSIKDGTAAPERQVDHRPADSARPDASGQHWVQIPAGWFTMGSPPSEPCRDNTRETQHRVTLTHAFEMAETEVTQAQFGQLLGYNPSYFVACGASCPVENTTWHEAAAYCNALSLRASLTPCYQCSGVGTPIGPQCVVASGYTGATFYSCQGYRLPTDAEWEYAYRAGTTTAYFDGTVGASCVADPAADVFAWYSGNAQGSPHPAGTKKANPWGLYDMAGNVWEWTNDRFVADLGTADATDPVGPAAGDRNVDRGGAWSYELGQLRAAFRCFDDPAVRHNFRGFRCVRTRNK